MSARNLRPPDFECQTADGTKPEAAAAAVAQQQANEAFERNVEPATVSIVQERDFKKAGVYQ
jgi:hypothetical protein